MLVISLKTENMSLGGGNDTSWGLLKSQAFGREPRCPTEPIFRHKVGEQEVRFAKLPQNFKSPHKE